LVNVAKPVDQGKTLAMAVNKKIGRSEPRRRRPTFLVRSKTDRQRLGGANYRRLLLFFFAERLLAFFLGERLALRALDFFLVAISIGSWRNEHHMRTHKRF
jgi:hypothetical protein